MKLTITKQIGFLLLLPTCGALIVLGIFSFFLVQTADDGSFINVAGRQRMLSQQLGAYASMVHIGQEEDRKPLRELVETFDRALDVLEHGGYVLDRTLPPAPPEMQEAIAGVKRLWRDLKVSLFLVADRPKDDLLGEEAYTFVRSGIPLLTEVSNRVVVTFEARGRALREGMLFIFSLIAGLDLALLIIGVWVTKRYVVERRRTEKALQESEERYRGIFEKIHDIFYRVDRQGIIQMISPSIERYGYRIEEVIGKHATIVYADPAEASKIQEVMEAQGSVSDYEITLKRKDGTPFLLSLTARVVFDDRGRPTGAEGILHDITGRKRMEEALRESEMRFRSVAQSANDAIIVTDSSGKMIFWNVGAHIIFGYGEEEMLGKPVIVLIPERYRDAHRKGWERLCSTGESHVIGSIVELHGLRNDGSEFPLELSLATWKIGGRTLYSSIIRDITERKRAEEEREHLIRQLRDALASVKTLRGLVPICASCKKIRDDKGYWKQLEVYIHDHSEAEFTHGICPECMKKLYPDFCKGEDQEG
jgi:PAS domain S-box-containing protein